MSISFQVWRLPTVLLGLAFSFASLAQGQKTTLGQIDAALQAGEADRALALIGSLPDGGARNAEARNLACRVHFTLQQWDAAITECQQAVQLDGGNSDYHLWLGRALGEKADRASFLTAYELAKQVRAEFEQAVRLNPRNAPALSDLGSFYQAAPGVVGGGLDKAEAVAGQLDKIDPARAHQLRGAIAEQRKDYTGAEEQYKQAIAESAHPAFQWTVLGSLYERRQQWPEMEPAIGNCVTAAARDNSAGVALYDGAGVLIKAKRDSELAARMLENYLSGTSRTEEAPAFIAHYRLARLKLQLGDIAGAKREQGAAFALAQEYHPAQELKF
jgi:tetratricopeptide (TPR) repeat protein